MLSRTGELLAKLTDDEQASLAKLCDCRCNQQIPGDHAEKFLGLGLAEVTCGGLRPTSCGRHVIARQAAH